MHAKCDGFGSPQPIKAEGRARCRGIGLRPFYGSIYESPDTGVVMSIIDPLFFHSMDMSAFRLLAVDAMYSH